MLKTVPFWSYPGDNLPARWDGEGSEIWRGPNVIEQEAYCVRPLPPEFFLTGPACLCWQTAAPAS